MSDEELQFDPTLKKKKKKKKKIDFDDEAEPEVPAAAAASGAADDDAGEGEGEGSAPASATAGAAAAATGKDAAAPTGGDALDDLDLDLDLNLAGKKKKKKKKVFEDDEEKGGDDAEGGKTQAASAAGGADDVGAGGDLAGDMGDLNLDDEFSKKKKKKKKAKDFDGNEENTDAAQAAGASGSTGGEKADSDRDYTHEELLARVFEIMRSKNPDMIAGEKRKFTVKPPQVMKSGTKKTSFVNFSEICKIFRRPPDHLLLFLMAELGTTGSVDGSNALVIKGRFQPKQIESVLKRYIREYVTCHTCKSPDTILRKENRLSFLQCETCGSKCSVASIKSGYQAVVGKRSAVRANDG